jgi:predicted dehydrogenase
MATSAADCDRMIAAAESADRSLGVAYYRRGYPSVRRVRELVQAGEIGRLERISINNEFPTSHRLDLVHYLVGPVTSVRPVPGSTSGYSFERMAGRIEAKVAGPVPVLVRMTDTWTETGMAEAIVLHGERGAIHLWDLKGGSLTVRVADGADRHEETGSLAWTHWGLIENFIAHLRSGEPLLCDGTEGRRSTAILDALADAQDSTDSEWTQIEAL